MIFSIWAMKGKWFKSILGDKAIEQISSQNWLKGNDTKEIPVKPSKNDVLKKKLRKENGPKASPVTISSQNCSMMFHVVCFYFMFLNLLCVFRFFLFAFLSFAFALFATTSMFLKFAVWLGMSVGVGDGRSAFRTPAQ